MIGGERVESRAGMVLLGSYGEKQKIRAIPTRHFGRSRRASDIFVSLCFDRSSGGGKNFPHHLPPGLRLAFFLRPAEINKPVVSDDCPHLPGNQSRLIMLINAAWKPYGNRGPRKGVRRTRSVVFPTFPSYLRARHCGSNGQNRQPSRQLRTVGRTCETIFKIIVKYRNFFSFPSRTRMQF